jgi:rhodanese-related sulfurtransferase
MTRFATVDELLADARSRLVRVSPVAGAALVEHGALLVDIRPSWQRAVDGEVPGSVIVERNHLEWRLHPASPWRVAQARPTQQWIVLCSEGYTSSLAADALNTLGIAATDIVGGFAAWRDAGLPTVPGPTAVDEVVRTPRPVTR